MLLVDARRLMGPNLLGREPLVIVELTFEAGETLDLCLTAYRNELARMRLALGFSAEIVPIVREHQRGAVIGYEAPIDAMLPCAEMSEWAALSAIERLASREALPLAPKQDEIASLLAAEQNTAMVELVVAARARDVAFLWDDDEICLGLGVRSRSFAKGAIPAPAAVPWHEIGSIPVALITGTNGKTTSSRLLAKIASEAGFVVGACSSDGITVGGATLERGDWTGPFAARTVLRNRGVELAVLETARGGILRRGLAAPTCDVALITNLSDDHLGLYGIDDVRAMARVKAVVGHAARRAVVLNAQDPNLIELSSAFAAPVTFFADLDTGDSAALNVISDHRRRGKSAVFARQGSIVCATGADELELMRLEDAPITFGGEARYNVENVLGVVAAAQSLGLDSTAICRGLCGFTAADNPGRGQLIETGGVRVMLDYGHNSAGVAAVLQLVSTLRSACPGNLSIVAGCAGDRTDAEIEEMARQIAASNPNHVYLRELPEYLRGRALGEVTRLFGSCFRRLGLGERAVSQVASEVAALSDAFAGAAKGDFVVVLVHIEHDEVAALLDRRVRALA